MRHVGRAAGADGRDRDERFDSDPAASSNASGPDRFYRLPGGCVTYDYSVAARTDPDLTAAADAALGFLPRTNS